MEGIDARTVVERVGEGDLAVELEVRRMPGRGLVCFLSGGTTPHVGGAVLAAPSPVLNGKRCSSCDVWSATVPGHRDAAVAEIVARELCVAFGEPVSVCTGVHVDDATPDQIGALVDACREAARRFAAGAQVVDDAGMDDELVLVDLLDHEVGSATKRRCHEEGLLHRAFSVFLAHDGRALMQRRAPGKYHSGGLWTNACCSHPRVGEETLAAASRRLAEETGVRGCGLFDAGSFVYWHEFANGIFEYELDHVIVGDWPRGVEPPVAEGLTPDAAEVSELRWMDVDGLVDEVSTCPELFSAWLPGVLSIALAGGRHA